MTYDDLVQSVQDYTENTESKFVAEIPTFVKQAEEMIVRAVPMANFRANKTSNLTSSDRFVATPDDYLAPYSLAVTDSGIKYQLYARDVSFLREMFPDETVTGRPRYYALFDDDTIIVAPTPDQAYAVELHYYFTPVGLSASNQNTWVGDNAEGAMLYGALYHAYVFMKGDADLMEHYKTLFQEGLRGMAKLGGERQKVDQFKHSEVAI